MLGYCIGSIASVAAAAGVVDMDYDTVMDSITVALIGSPQSCMYIAAA